MGIRIGFRIGFIGMGLMGVPMSKRLLDAGFTVSVWNRNPEKTHAIAEYGATVCDSLENLAAAADIICLCVTDTSAVEQLVFGCGDLSTGLTPHLNAQHILVDFSSISPSHTVDFAQRIRTETQTEWIDAPVSGGVVGAEQGTLSIMAGGNADVIDSIRPMLSAVSAKVTRMGEAGSGQATKVCNQMIVSCNVMVMAEAMAMAQANGVDIRQIPSALAGGFADSTPLQLTGTRMANSHYDDIQWHVKTLLKDLYLAGDCATQLQQTVPMSGLAQELMQQHADAGYAEADPATLIEKYRM